MRASLIEIGVTILSSESARAASIAFIINLVEIPVIPSSLTSSRKSSISIFLI